MVNFEDTRYQQTNDHRTDLTEVYRQTDTNFNVAVTVKDATTNEILDFSEHLAFTFRLQEKNS